MPIGSSESLATTRSITSFPRSFSSGRTGRRSTCSPVSPRTPRERRERGRTFSRATGWAGCSGAFDPDASPQGGPRSQNRPSSPNCPVLPALRPTGPATLDLDRSTGILGDILLPEWGGFGHFVPGALRPRPHGRGVRDPSSPHGPSIVGPSTRPPTGDPPRTRARSSSRASPVTHPVSAGAQGSVLEVVRFPGRRPTGTPSVGLLAPRPGPSSVLRRSLGQCCAPLPGLCTDHSTSAISIAGWHSWSHPEDWFARGQVPIRAAAVSDAQCVSDAPTRSDHCGRHEASREKSGGR